MCGSGGGLGGGGIKRLGRIEMSHVSIAESLATRLLLKHETFQ
jgi:hypothetical protein